MPKAQAMIMPKKYFFDKDGNPLAFGKVYTYQAGTTIDKVTYTTENGDVANPNPVILNGEGYATIYLDGSYNIVVDDQNDNNIWTEDPVSSNIAEEWVFCQTATYISSTSFSLVGNSTNQYETGRRVRIDNGVATPAYSTIVSSSFAAGVTTVVVTDAVVEVGITEACVSIISVNSRTQGVVLDFPTVEGDPQSIVESLIIKIGDTIEAEERTTGNGGGAKWDAVDVNDVTPNGYNIIQCNGVPTIAIVLRSTKYPGRTKIEEIIKPRQWGARAEEIGAITGFDNSPVSQEIVNHVTANGGAEIDWGTGAYYFASNVNIPSVDTGGLGQNGCIFKGVGRKSTELFTDQNIDMFTHVDRLVVRDLSVVQRSEATNKWKGVAFRANGQCRFCIFENVEMWWFKFGNLQRFSLWNSYRDVYYVNNACGIKLARSSDMEDVTNPSPAGGWNAGDGWFHNMNTFENIFFNGGSGSLTKNEGGGEVGFWGAVQGSSFTNITVQNYNRDGTQSNVILPGGEEAIPMVITAGGPTSSDSFNNHIENLYFEVNYNGLRVENQRKLTVTSWFVQGQAGTNTMLEVDDSKVHIIGQTGQTSGYTTRMKLVNNSVVISDGQLVAPGTVDDIEAGSFYSPYNIWTENADIGDINNKFGDLWLSQNAYIGTESSDPKLTTDDGVFIDDLGIIKASRNGNNLELNSRGLNGKVAIWNRSGSERGNVSVTNNRGQACEYHITANNVMHTGGTGSPEGVLTAGVGSTYGRTDGGAGTTLYVKETGAGNTGWVAK